MDISAIKNYLRGYDGPDMNIMEVCGSHTAAIAKNGIPSLLSPHLHLLSGPGCPVCVTPSAYVDRLLELAKDESACIVTFGDLLRVPGSTPYNLSQARGDGARVEMVYSPMDILPLAAAEPETVFIFAAVGFETTTPVYALLCDAVVKQGIKNIRLLTALKTMPEVIDALMEKGAPIDAFLAPGHVSVVTGSAAYRPLAEKYLIPFAVSGFSGEEILISLYGLVKARGEGRVMNFYPSVVTEEGNREARDLILKYFEKADAVWRGLGPIPGSGRVLKKEYAFLDAGSRGLDRDTKANPACSCDRVLMGKIPPTACPLFGKACTPMNPQGACMVSGEGSCNSWFVNKRGGQAPCCE